MARPFPLALLACLLGACGQRIAEVELTLNGVGYRIPRAKVEALVQDQGQTLVRVNSQSREIKLTHNSRTDREQRETGKLTISGVNDRLGPYEALASPVGTVVCIDGVDWNCGFLLDDNGVRWSVVFARNRLRDVASLKQQALLELRSYREKAPTNEAAID